MCEDPTQHTPSPTSVGGGFDFTYPGGVWYHLMVLVRVSPVANNPDYLFVFLLAINLYFVVIE